MVGPRFTTVPTRVIKPYTQNGVPAEVETGILFKFPPDGTTLSPVPEKY
jgi:hypothetical protein